MATATMGPMVAVFSQTPAGADAARAGNSDALLSEAPDAVGMPGGAGQVSGSGDYTFTYSIDVPLARKGQQPEVALSYSSSRPVHGGVAAGWALSAGGAIAVDGSAGTVAAEWPDGGTQQRPRPFLDPAGNPMAVDPSIPVEAGAVGYRATKDTSFTRYEYLAGVADQPYWWRVRYSDGTTAFYGSKAAHPYQYAPLVERQDEDGHRLVYLYDTVGRTAAAPVGDQPREFLLIGIDYMAPGAALAYAQVRFTHADPAHCGDAAKVLPVGARLDHRSGFARLTGTRKLTEIKTLTKKKSGAGYDLRDTYSLRYSDADRCDGGTAPFRELAEVQRSALAVGAAAATMTPPTRFTYGKAVSYTEDGHYGDSVPAPTNLRLPESVDTNQYREGEATSTPIAPVAPCGAPFCPTPVLNDSSPAWMGATGQSTGESVGRMYLDVNADGLVDVLERSGGLPKLASMAPATGGCTVDVYLNNGTALVKQAANGAFAPFSLRNAMADVPVRPATPVSGAGELLCSLSRSFSPNDSGGSRGDAGVRCSDGPWGASAGWGSMQQVKHSFVDMNADRLPDLVSQPIAPVDCPYLSTHGVPPPVYRATDHEENLNPDPHWHPEYIDDWLRPDQPLDVVRPITKRQRYLYVYTNTGNGFATTPLQVKADDETVAPFRRIAAPPPTVMGGYFAPKTASGTPVAMADLNGDGQPDMVYDTQLGDRGFAILGRPGPSWQKEVHLPEGDQNSALGMNSRRVDVVGEDPFRGNEPDSYTGVHTGGVAQDFNGDGLADRVEVVQTDSGAQTRVNYNTGNGFATSDQDGEFLFGEGEPDTSRTDTFRAPDLTNRNWQDYPQTGERYTRTKMHDLDGDGITDMLLNDKEGNRAKAYLGGGRQWVRAVPASPSVAQALAGRVVATGTTFGGSVNEAGDRADYRFAATHQAIDLNGDGLLDLVEDNDDNNTVRVRYARAITGIGDQFAPSRLMRTVTNGSGAKTTVTYSRNTKAQRWTATQITTDPGQGQLSLVVDHRYLDPVFAADARGRHGFRGFAETHTLTGNAPGASDDLTKVTRMSYDQDPQGAVTLTATVLGHLPASRLSEAQAGVMGMVENEYEHRGPRLVPPGTRADYPTAALLPTKQITRTCAGAGGQTLQACRASGSKQVASTSWKGHVIDGLYVMELPAAKSTTFTNADGVEETRATNHFHDLRWSARMFNAAASATRDSVKTGAELRVLGETTYYYHDADFLYLKMVVVDDADLAVLPRVTRYLYHGGDGAARGQLRRVWEPEQVARHGYDDDAPGYTEFGYDEHGVHVTRTRNPVGHVVASEVDLATGAVLEAEGPNYACPDGPDPGAALDPSHTCTYDKADEAGLTELTRTEVDGLGRGLRTFVHRIGDTGRTNGVEVSRATYDDLAAHRSGGTQAVTHTSEESLGDGRFTWSEVKVDGLGRTLRSSVRQDESVVRTTSYGYDSNGHLRDVFAQRGDGTDGTLVFRKVFDALGRTTEEREESTRGPLALQRFTYDGLTATTTEVTHDGSNARQTKTTTDMAGQLVTVAQKVFGSVEAVTRYRYDGMGNTRSVTDPEGVVTTMSHDYYGNRVSLVAPGGRAWRYGYDHNGNLTSTTEPVPAGAQVEAYTHHLEYDDMGRVTKQIPAKRDLREDDEVDEVDEFLVGPTTYTYDRAHDSLDAAGGTANFQVGRLSSTASRVATVVNRYDDLGMPVAVGQQVHALDGIPGVRSDRLQETTEFNAVGMPQSRWYTAHHGQDVSFTGPIVRTGYDRDGVGSSTRITVGDKVLGIAHDRNKAGNLARRRINTGATSGLAVLETRFDRDQYGRLTGIQTGTPDGPDAGDEQDIQRYKQVLDYYDNDQIKTLAEQLGDTAQPTATTTYTYDDRHQLRTAVQAGGAGYNGDFFTTLNGRMGRANVATADARLAARNVTYRYQDGAAGQDPMRLAALEKEDETDLTSYTYDESGNTTSRTLPDGTTLTQRWDGANLRKVIRPGGESETYFYDGGTRVAAVHRTGTGEVTSVRRYFGSQEIVHTPGQPAQYRQGVSLGGQTVARVDGDGLTGTIEHYTTTPQGHHVLALAAEDGATRRVVSYGPFGEVLAELTAQGTPQGKYPQYFNGKDHDPTSGLSHYGARYYDPLALQWSSPDPLYRGAPDLRPTQPQSANLYTFTANDPVNKSDPTGLDPADPTAGEVIYVNGVCDVVGCDGVSIVQPDFHIPGGLFIGPLEADDMEWVKSFDKVGLGEWWERGIRDHMTPLMDPRYPSTMTRGIMDLAQSIDGMGGGRFRGGRYGAAAAGKGGFRGGRTASAKGTPGRSRNGHVVTVNASNRRSVLTPDRRVGGQCDAGGLCGVRSTAIAATTVGSKVIVVGSQKDPSRALVPEAKIGHLAVRNADGTITDSTLLGNAFLYHGLGAFPKPGLIGNIASPVARAAAARIGDRDTFSEREYVGLVRDLFSGPPPRR